jgi:hypothetical protein
MGGKIVRQGRKLRQGKGAKRSAFSYRLSTITTTYQIGPITIYWNITIESLFHKADR